MMKMVGILDPLDSGKGVFELVEDISKSMFIPIGGFFLKGINGGRQAMVIVKTLVDKALERRVSTPHGFHPKRFRIVKGKSFVQRKEGTVMRFCSRLPAPQGIFLSKSH